MPNCRPNQYRQFARQSFFLYGFMVSQLPSTPSETTVMTDIQGFARLGENPKLKFLPGNSASDVRSIAEVNLCLSNFRKRGDGEDEDRGFWVEATFWDEQAEILARNFRQGYKIFVIGDLYSDHWIDKETGEKRSRPKLRVKLFFPDLRSLVSLQYKPRTPRESSQSQVGEDAAPISAGELTDSSNTHLPDQEIPFEDMSERFESLTPEERQLLATGRNQKSVEESVPTKDKRQARKSTAA